MSKIKITLANMRNAYVECDPSETWSMRYGITAAVSPVLCPLFDKLSRKHPSWEFRAIDYGSKQSDGAYYYNKFFVVEMGEELGWITYDRSWRNNNEIIFQFDCERLRKKRTRGTLTHTKNMDKAVQTITANMYGITAKERMARAISETRTLVSSTVSDANFKFVNRARQLATDLAEFAIRHQDEFIASIKGPAERSHAEQLAATLERHKMMQSIHEATHTLRSCAVVMEFGGRYYVQYDTSLKDVNEYTLDELPETLKVHMALLKLVDHGAAVEGIGVRKSNHEFFVIV